MTIHHTHQSTSHQRPEHPWRTIVVDARTPRTDRRAGFALPTVREVPRRAARELATW